MDGPVRPQNKEHLIPEIRKATVDDARDIASRIRPSDRREALAYFGVAPSILLPFAANSEDTYVGVSDEGRPEVIFGVSPLAGVPGMGMVWLMATPAIETDRKAQLQFLRNSKPFLDKLHEKYPVLGNYVDERNDLHLKWVKWLGFRVLKRVPEWGAEKRPFLQIISIRKETTT